MKIKGENHKGRQKVLSSDESVMNLVRLTQFLYLKFILRKTKWSTCLILRHISTCQKGNDHLCHVTKCQLTDPLHPTDFQVGHSQVQMINFHIQTEGENIISPFSPTHTCKRNTDIGLGEKKAATSKQHAVFQIMILLSLYFCKLPNLQRGITHRYHIHSRDEPKIEVK